jgi:hypothetical protein
MATDFCQACKQSHPGRSCDYDEKGECAETLDVDGIPKPSREELGKGPVAAEALPNKASRPR